MRTEAESTLDQATLERIADGLPGFFDSDVDEGGQSTRLEVVRDVLAAAEREGYRLAPIPGDRPAA